MRKAKHWRIIIFTEVGVLAEHPWGTWVGNGDGTHSRICTLDNSHVDKANCSGGEATCHTLAACEICGSEYGHLAPEKHSGGRELRNEKPATCTVNGYTGDTYCKGCNALLAEEQEIPAEGHRGGEATCVSSAECEVCHEKYGELVPNHHAGLRHVDAKDATVKAEGNMEYWYCAACGKYFRGKELTQEITKEETAIAKLKPAIPTTGDESSMETWIMVLCISGGALLAAAIVLLLVLRRKGKK